MEPDELRAAGDRQLADKLLRNPDVSRAIERIHADKKSQRTRRHLLATALRLAESAAPDIHRIVGACRETLSVDTPIELYVYPDSGFNAACVRPERGRLFVLFSSGLFEAFAPEEMRFVVGHELGHHLFSHHDIPVSQLLGGESPLQGPLSLEIYAWARYAEISADRAGLACAGDLNGATGTLFKLASGLRGGGGMTVRLDEFVAQVGDLQDEAATAERDDEPSADWFSTHPFSPLRLKAVQLFATSDVLSPGGISRQALEAQTQELMTLMDPSYLTDTSDAAKAMRRLLFAGGVVVAAASGGISAEELAALERFLGAGAVPERMNIDAIREDLPRRTEMVKAEVPPLRRAQVVRDLCVVALADGHVDEAEERILCEIAEAVGVDASLVARTIASSAPLD